MGSSYFSTLRKRFWLCFKHGARSLLKRTPFALSIVLLLFPVVVSLFLLLPSLFLRSPNLSYLLEKLSLPLTYEYNGKIVLLDPDGNIVDQNVLVSIGGYSIEVNTNEEFNLKFSSEFTDYVYVSVEYFKMNNVQDIETRKFPTNKNIIINGDIYIYEKDI